MKAQNVEFYWNSKGTAVLVMTHTSVDRTGKSYYGETGLQYLSADSSVDCNVSLGKKRDFGVPISLQIQIRR